MQAPYHVLIRLIDYVGHLKYRRIVAQIETHWNPITGHSSLTLPWQNPSRFSGCYPWRRRADRNRLGLFVFCVG
jgi:hypothetical protein